MRVLYIRAWLAGVIVGVVRINVSFNPVIWFGSRLAARLLPL
jgi:hypothetical protein